MDTISLKESTQKLSVKEGQLIHKDGDTLLEVYPLASTEQVLVYGNGQITTQAIKECLKEGIRIVYMNKFGKFLGRTEPEYPKNIRRRLNQYKVMVNPEIRLAWSKELLTAKIQGEIIQLRRYHERNIEFPYTSIKKNLKEGQNKIKEANSIPELLGIEGNCAKLYYGIFEYILPEEYNWQGRKYHPATDTGNAVLSSIYGCCANELRKKCEIHGFDRQCGILHEPGYGRGGLPYDLIEIFRAVFCDNLAVKIMTKYPKQLQGKNMTTIPDDFMPTVHQAFAKAMEIRQSRQKWNISETMSQLTNELMLFFDGKKEGTPDFQNYIPIR